MSVNRCGHDPVGPDSRSAPSVPGNYPEIWSIKVITEVAPASAGSPGAGAGISPPTVTLAALSGTRCTDSPCAGTPHVGVRVRVIADLIHVIEYIRGAAWSFFDKAEPVAETWVGEQLAKILDGKARHVASGIRCRATSFGYRGNERTGADRCADYLTNLADHLRIEVGHDYRIGSNYRVGEMEAGSNTAGPARRIRWYSALRFTDEGNPRDARGTRTHPIRRSRRPVELEPAQAGPPQLPVRRKARSSRPQSYTIIEAVLDRPGYLIYHYELAAGRK